MSRRDQFETIRSEGALLPTELLQRVRERDKELGGLRGDDYGLPPNEPLNEAIVRSYNRLVGAWASFQEARARLPEDEPGTTVTRDRWLLVLLQELGYGRVQVAPAVDIDGKTYPVSHAWGNSPIHLVGCNIKLDRRTRGVAGAATQSPHGTVQELLNRSDERLWGIVSNGLQLRLLRDNSSLTRQAYVEFDLEQMMDGEVYADFVLLWMVCHASRVEGEQHECWLEGWSQEAAKQGTRALEGLRDGVEAAISALGTGFLVPGRNAELKAALRDGELSTQDYYREVLRLVYRLLFLFVAEDRALLHHPDASEDARTRYTRWYSTRRLRDLSEKRRGTKHGDLWEGLKLVMRGLGGDDGCQPLGLPALGSFLWSDRALPLLEAAYLSNRSLLEAMRALATVREGKVLRAVDYKNLGAEELGSVYESLLELHPRLDIEAGSFTLDTAAGNERKTTGSYYTPTSLISVLLDSTLDPVLDEAAAKGEEAILSLKVVDPACGSGHFLVAAAHRIASRLATIRTGDGEPSPEATRHALRDVVSRCVYGVDVNPMAVELCKVSLWMEAIDPGRPLSFLDAHIKCGNSLLGTTFDLAKDGVPDEAFVSLDADDKDVVKSLRKQNAAERAGQLTLADAEEPLVDALAADAAALESVDDESVEALHEKERRFALSAASEAYERAKAANDAWCAAFVCTKTAGSPRITTGLLQRLEAGANEPADNIREELADLAQQYGFFHWEVEFPHVFRGPDGGFDVVLGNPPWEQVVFQDREFFAARSPDVARVSRSSERQKLIEALRELDPVLHEEYSRALQTSKGEQHFLRRSGVFPLSGVGRHLITGGLFVECARRLVAPTGTVGLIVPSEVATGDTLRLLFRDMIESRTLHSLFDFENGQIFPAVDSRYKFALLTLGGTFRRTEASTFVFFAQAASDVMDVERQFTLTAEEFALVNPRSRTCPTFRNAREAAIALRIYRQRGILGDGWDLATRPGLFNMALQSGLFRTAEEIGTPAGDVALSYAHAAAVGYLPLYEGKMVHQFDHRWASVGDDDEQLAKDNPHVRPRPRYWVEASEVASRDRGREWFLCFRDITNATNERTAIAAAVPRVGIAHNLPIIDCKHPEVVLAILNSYVVDFIARTKVGGMHLTIAVLEQLPVDLPTKFLEPLAWLGAPASAWMRDRVLELSYTASDVEAFAASLTYTGQPFRWDEQRRFQIRAELDAMLFHLYGLERDAVDYVMDTFPIVRSRDVKAYGEYRTKRVILEIYDELGEAIERDAPYQTRLDPPPADPRVAHASGLTTVEVPA